MAEIQTIDHGAPNWDKIFNANFKAIGNGSTTFSDTGWIEDGITLMNGAKENVAAGDKPALRIVQLGSLNFLMVFGVISGITPTSENPQLAVASFPDLVQKWFAEHEMANSVFSTIGGSSALWHFNKSTLELTKTSLNDSNQWYLLNHVFIA